MRPRSLVVMLAHTAEEIGQWRLILENRCHMRVVGFTDFAAARAEVESNPNARAVLTNRADLADGLTGVRDIGVVLFGVAPKDTLADRVELAGPELARRVITALMDICERKPGPKPRAWFAVQTQEVMA